MAGILDDLFEDLIKDEDVSEGGNGEETTGVQEKEAPDVEHKEDSQYSVLFPTGDAWRQFKKEHEQRA